MPNAKSFDDLIKAAPRAGTASVVGTLSQSSENGKFVLTLQDGSALTLETAAVMGHAELGGGVVRVDLDATKLPTLKFGDPNPSPWVTAAGGNVVPFALATPHQASVAPFGSPLGSTIYWYDHRPVHTNPLLDSGATGNPRIPYSLD